MVTFKADLTRPVQENFLGLGAIYHAFAGMPDDAGRVYTEEQCALEAKRVSDLRVKIVRSYFTWYAWDAATNTWDWENERCQAFYRWAQRMKDAGITVVLNVGWWNVGDQMGNFHAGASPFYVENDWTKTVHNYADWVSEVVREIIIKRGFDNIKYLCLFTEPNECIVPSLPFEGAQYHELWYDSALAAHKTLVKNGLRYKVKLLGPQEGIGARPWFTDWAINVKHCDEWLDGISMHSYLLYDETEKENVHSGNKSVVLALSGSRIQQNVKLKKHTDYTFSVWMKRIENAPVTEDSSIVFGIFGKGSFYHYFFNYCDTRDTIFTKNLRIAEMKSDWQRYEISFNSGELEDVSVCIYNNVKRIDGARENLYQGLPFLFSNANCIFVDDCSLREKDTEKECLIDPSFEGQNDWYLLWSRFISTDHYTTWLDYEKDAIRMISPKLKTEYWHDEYNVQFDKKSDPKHGIWLALGQIAMMNGGGKSSFMWTLFDQQWPNNHSNTADAFEDGVHLHGLMPVLTKTLVPHPSYYAWGLISRYTGGEGTKCYNCVNYSFEKVAANINILPDGNITLSVVNYSDKEQTCTFEVNRLLERTFYRHTYNSKNVLPDETASLPAADKVFENVTTEITDTLPAMSIAVYTTLRD